MEEIKVEANIKVLIVDDFQTTRRSLRLLLRSYNYKYLEEAVDGKEALRKVEDDDKIGLILLDWNMPKMNGLAFLKELRKNSDKDYIKIIMVTAESLQDHIMSAVKAGVDEYIIKPVTQENLQDKIISVVNKEVKKAKMKLNDRIAKLKQHEESLKSEYQNVVREGLLEIKNASSIYPWLPDPHFYTGYLYQELGELIKAAKEYETALTVDTRHSNASIALGKIYLKWKQGDKAVRLLNVVASRKPTSDVLQALGEAYLTSGDNNKAILTFKKSIDLYENIINSKNKKPEVSTEMAQKHEGLGVAYQNKFDETKETQWQQKSIQSLEKSIEYDHRYISAHFNLICAYKKAGEEEKAAVILKRTAEITPNDSEGWVSLAKVYIKTKQDDKAAFAIKKAVEHSDNPAHTYFEIGSIYIEHDLDTALKFLNKSLEIEPIQAHTLNKLGIIYRKKGMHEKAIEHYRKGHEIDPDDEIILYNMASAILDSNDPEKIPKATFHLKKAIEIAPNLQSAHDLLSNIQKLK
ncbi:MAG: tetratricopeptide repeat protein [Nitrospinae bacterium]|nr:tetratricopeptide repeat protein [Nitrospinota bacterium]